MTVDQILTGIQFTVDQKGQMTGVFLPVDTWRALLAWIEELEDFEDRKLLRERLPLGRFSEEPGMLRWEEVEAALVDDKTP